MAAPSVPGAEEKIVYKTPVESQDHLFFGSGPAKGALASLLTAKEEKDRFVGFVPVRMVRYAYSLNTPALQWIMNYLIELTIQKNTSPPELLVIPDGPYTHEKVYAFIGEAVDHLDTVETLVPDITHKVSPSVQKSNKMQFYKDLEEELSRTGIDFVRYVGLRQGFILPTKEDIELSGAAKGYPETNEGGTDQGGQ